MIFNIRYFLFLFSFTISAITYGYTDSISLDERMSLHIDAGDYAQKATFHISYPGSDAYLEKGSYHVTDKMPACLIVLGDSLESDQLEKFINELDVTTVNNRKLLLEQYKGTWIFLDKDPHNSSFIDTLYVIQPKNYLTFGQLLQYVGGKKNSRVSIEFSRGCANLATRPFIPEQVNMATKKFKNG